MKKILTLTALAALLSACASLPETKGTASSKSPQATLPFGAVEESCGARGSALGKLIEKNGKWKLYDTRPGAVGPRNFFVTGFKDGCARKVTGAVALFGDLGLYELVNYGGGGGAPPPGVEQTSEDDARTEERQPGKERVCAVDEDVEDETAWGAARRIRQP